MDINHLLAIGSVAGFVVLLLFWFQDNPRKFYLLYVLYLLPIMDLAITPVEWGRLRVFDFISYIYAFILINDFLKVKKRFKMYNVLSVLFIIVLVFGSLNSLYVRNSLISISAILPIFVYSKSLLGEFSDNEEFEKATILILRKVALFSVAFLAVQMVVGLRFTFYPVLNRNTAVEDGVIRYPSFFHDPQMYGQYLVMVCLLFFVNYKSAPVQLGLTESKSQTVKSMGSLDIINPDYKNYLLFVTVIIALLQTGGRSALIAVFTGMLFLVFFLGTQYKVMITGIIAFGVAIYLFFGSSLTVFNRAEHFSSDLSFRVALWDEAREIFLKYPVLGVGIGNFKLYNADFSNNYTINEDYEVIFFGYGQPESGYWMILTETGLLGFIIIFTFMLWPVYTGVRSYMQGNKNLLIFIIIAGIISLLVTFISAYSLYDRRIIMVLATFICILILESSKTKNVYQLNT